MPVSVLLIEDEVPAFETIQATCADIAGVSLSVEPSFNNALTRIRRDSPDIIILDLFENALDQDRGTPIWEQIWQHQFCPLIFHTAHELPATAPAVHPFVKYVRKAAGSDRQIALHLREFEPHVSGAQRLRAEISRDVSAVLKAAAPIIWASHPDPASHGDVLARALRRRIAASLDVSTSGATMSHWEQYIVPCLGNCVLMGDILIRSGEAAADPENFRVNLTPSCDIAQDKVRNLLVMKCKPPIEYLRGANLHQSNDAGRRRNLPSRLSTEHQGGFIALPSFGSIIPVMAASLRELELIPVGQVGIPGAAGATYHRVASIDSPFREKIAWAHIQISGRPATPDCDCTHLIDALATLPQIQ